MKDRTRAAIVSTLLISITSVSLAQKVEVFEKSAKPEFQNWGKNTLLAQGYGFVILLNGDSLKGPLKVEKKNNVITEFSIKSKKQKYSFKPAEVKAFDFYPYQIFAYDPFLPGNPKFHPGYVITNNGVKLTGQVAVMTVMGTDWMFFPKKIYFIPTNAEMASSMQGGDLREVGQSVREGLAVYDAFGDGYLQRLVSGTLCLSYNPNPKVITRSLYYTQSTATDPIQVKLIQKIVEEGINEGKPLNEAIRVGKDVSGMIDVIPMSTEIIDVQYFLTDTRTGKVSILKEATFQNIVEPIFEGCASYARLSKNETDALYNFKKIEGSVKWFNTACK